MKIISISGNIASGKSSVISMLSTMYPTIVHACDEPLSPDMLVLLKNYYQHPMQYCFEFQYKILLDKYIKLKKIIDTYGGYKVILLERSFETDYQCFFTDYWVNTMNAITDDEREVMATLYETIRKYMDQLSHVTVYLTSDNMNELMSRIADRGREGEDELSTKRLTMIERAHSAVRFDYEFDSSRSIRSLAIVIKTAIIDGWFTYDGSVSLYTGPMFSGKTSMLVNKLTEHALNGQRVICIKFTGDNRNGEGADVLRSHDGREFPAISSTADIFKSLRDTHINVHSYDVIGVDEGQFYNNIDIFVDYCANIGKEVHVTMLSGAFNRTSFVNITNICDHVVMMYSKCSVCGLSAPYSRRLGTSTNLVVIGGTSEYAPMCRRCHLTTHEQI